MFGDVGGYLEGLELLAEVGDEAVALGDVVAELLLPVLQLRLTLSAKGLVSVVKMAEEGKGGDLRWASSARRSAASLSAASLTARSSAPEACGAGSPQSLSSTYASIA